MSRACKVAVIGAGVSGLVAGRELLREGHQVVVFEKADRVGGTWVYDPRTDSDPVGLDPFRRVVHGSLYASLRTNLPRPLMGFRDYPFPDPSKTPGDRRAFPGPEEVLRFIEAFARDSGVLEVVRFRAEVVRVAMGRRNDEWMVEWQTEAEAEKKKEEFEAVVVCNGHHTEFRRLQIVVIIGMGASACDISKEISKVAKEVHLASRSTDIEAGKLDGHINIWQHSMVDSVHEDGKVDFVDGSSLIADAIIYCTGYKYNFPFLEMDDTVNIDDNRVGPLYKHVFPPRVAPWLSFVGLPYKTIIFRMLELQSKWIAQVLSNKIALPPEEDMITSVNNLYLQMEETGKPKHHTHSLGADKAEYMNYLAAEVGEPPIEEWRFQMYDTLLERIYSHHDDGGYRDEWDVDH
ncbi:flavin-containing monooxygenase FMO GS-OX5-like isoform X1 [Phoenix dactylifera]|uniref:Flavin-containing monooxygenase n=1 Tax=Phoenix dactylifera TaxID=42345 RepID=A0A8B9A769_PHODC|nr:flavin-containing monooxygenase FMO GS-OX5-like isoform X1 [Phoenix dactylifera]